jgi:hypothetical protein
MAERKKTKPTDTERLDKLEAMAGEQGMKYFFVNYRGEIEAFDYRPHPIRERSIRAAIDAAPEPRGKR